MSRSYGQLCPIARTLDLVGDRWTILIIRDLALGASKFSEFRHQSPGIPTKMLADRLKSLEADGIVERRLYCQHPLRAEYHLTDLGRSLEPVLTAIFDWGLTHRLTSPERKAVKAHVARRRAEIASRSARAVR